MEFSPTKQEISLWTSILEELKSLSTTKTESDMILARINKVHYKLELRKEKTADTDFNLNAGVRILGMYREALEGISKEEKLIEEAIDNVDNLITLQESLEGFLLIV